MGNKVFGIWVCLWLCGLSYVFAKNDKIPKEYTVLRDFTEEYLVYDGGYGGYVPYMQHRHDKLKTVSFWLDAKAYKPYRLVFYVERDSYLYIQKKLAYRFDKAGWQSLSIDSLRRLYGDAPIFCTFYDTQYRLPLPNLAVAIQKKQATTAKNASPAPTSLDRALRPDSHKDWAIIGFLLILVGYVALFNYNPKVFTSFFSIRSSLSPLSRKDPALIQKPFNAINFAYMGMHGLLLSYFYMLWAVYADASLNFLWIPFKTAFLGLLVNQIYFWLWAWGGLVGKLFLLLLFGRLLNIERQVVQIHFFEYMRYMYLFYAVWGTLGALVFCCYGEYNPLFFGFSSYFIVFFHLFQAIIISFFVIRQTQFLSLYIFYYLCSTELTPWLIGIKVLFFD